MGTWKIYIAKLKSILLLDRFGCHDIQCLKWQTLQLVLPSNPVSWTADFSYKFHQSFAQTVDVISPTSLQLILGFIRRYLLRHKKRCARVWNQWTRVFKGMSTKKKSSGGSQLITTYYINCQKSYWRKTKIAFDHAEILGTGGFHQA